MSEPPELEPWTMPQQRAGGGGLERRVARGLTWTLVDTWGAQLLGLVIFLVLVSLLSVAEIGLVALAAAFVAVVQLFVDQGLGDALIQRQSLTRRQIDTAFWTAMLTGSLLTAVGVISAPVVAVLVGQPRLEPILQVLSITFVLVALSSIQTALLRREMQFRSLAIRRLAAVGGGGLVGIALAFAGYGAWALVAQQLAAAAVSVVALWTASRWRPTFQYSRADFRSLFGFGVNIVAGDLLFFLSRNVDNLLIGAFLGPTALGFYAVGYRFLDTSTSLLVNGARKLVFPTFSRLQDDRERFRAAYTRMTRVVGAVILPGFVGLTLVAEETVVVLVGARWAEAGTVAMILFLIGPVLTLQAFTGQVLNSVGHPEVTLRFRLVSTVTNVAGFVIAVFVFQSIVAVAAAYVIRGYLLAPLALYWQQRYAGIPVLRNLAGLRGITLATLAMAGAVIGVELVLGDQLGRGLLLVAEVVVGIVVYAVALIVLERGLVADTLRVAAHALPGGKRATGALAGRRSAGGGGQAIDDELDEV